jgi:cytochrome c oxidase assembly factor CtaG
MSGLPLAYDGPPALTVHTAFTQWEFDRYLATGIAIVAVLYVVGVVRMHQRGDGWSWLRTLSFLVGGLGTIVLATMSAIGAYDDTLFTDHMVQHMILSMVSPVFLALGAPVTLALRTLHTEPRKLLLGALHSKVARFFTWTPIAWAHFVLLPFVLYHTQWYAATLEHNWLHELLHLQILIAGCLFFWPLLGLDPLPGRISYPARMLVTFLSLPFHAILGLSIMLQTSLIAGDYYRTLGRPWGPSLSADQYAGGGVLWASGDLVGLLFFGTLFFQWQRAEGRSAIREDRRLDRVERAAEVAVAASAGSEDDDGVRAPAATAPGTVRPWWEVDAGPLAERAKRENWANRSD